MQTNLLVLTNNRHDIVKYCHARYWCVFGGLLCRQRCEIVATRALEGAQIELR